MQEKDMMNDILTSTNASLANYASVIAQTDNQELRQSIQQIRNNCETFQYDLYRTAVQKGFYKPADPADQQDLQSVKSQFTM